MNGLRTSVTGLRDKLMSLRMGTGFPKDSNQGRFPAPTHDKTNPFEDFKRKDFRCLWQNGQTISQLSGKNTAAAFLALSPNTGVTDEWSQESKHDYWIYPLHLDSEKLLSIDFNPSSPIFISK